MRVDEARFGARPEQDRGGDIIGLAYASDRVPAVQDIEDVRRFG
jgi:hypothetical protein